MFCQCGCGKPTNLATRTFKSKGLIKGEPCRYLPGHSGAAATRRDKVTPDLWTVTDCGYDTPCWVWNLGRKNSNGHCSVWISGREYSAHRTVYEMNVGPIPKGLVLDHLCENPPCVNPDHLNPTSSAENIRRSKLTKLNWDIVAEIRTSPLGAVKGAEAFGISKATWYSVRRYDTWDDR